MRTLVRTYVPCRVPYLNEVRTLIMNIYALTWCYAQVHVPTYLTYLIPVMVSFCSSRRGNRDREKLTIINDDNVLYSPIFS